MRECLWKLYDSRWCNLKAAGYAIGWFAVTYRTVGIGAVAVTIADLPDDDNMSTWLYSALLAYGFISLAANFLLLVGISKKKDTYLVPYLSISGIEASVEINLLIGGIIFFVRSGTTHILSYFVPCSTVIVGANIYFWLCLMRLFNQFKESFQDDSSTETQESYFKYTSCSWGCHRSDSLDIGI
jgi:hypothetical protein